MKSPQLSLEPIFSVSTDHAAAALQGTLRANQSTAPSVVALSAGLASAKERFGQLRDGSFMLLDGSQITAETLAQASATLANEAQEGSRNELSMDFAVQLESGAQFEVKQLCITNSAGSELRTGLFNSNIADAIS